MVCYRSVEIEKTERILVSHAELSDILRDIPLMFCHICMSWFSVVCVQCGRSSMCSFVQGWCLLLRIWLNLVHQKGHTVFVMMCGWIKVTDCVCFMRVEQCAMNCIATTVTWYFFCMIHGNPSRRSARIGQMLHGTYIRNCWNTQYISQNVLNFCHF